MVGIALAGSGPPMGLGTGGTGFLTAKGSPSSYGSAGVCAEITCAGVFWASERCRKKLVKPGLSALAGLAGALTGSSTGMSICAWECSAGIAAVSRPRLAGLAGRSGSSSCSYWGRSRCFSISAPTVSRSATISSTTNSTVKIMTEAILEKTATDPCANAPEITPPQCRAVPSFHSAGMIPMEEAYASFTSAGPKSQ